MTISIADLEVTDDLDVPYSPEEYVDQANPAPIKPGNYRFVSVKSEVAADKDGKPLLADGKFPTVRLLQAKIVEPVELERQVGVFTDIRFKPYTRKDGTGGDVVVSDVKDILRAFDETQAFVFSEAPTLLDQHLQQGTPFLAQVKWEGYDKAYADAEFQKLGATTPAERKGVAKAIANAIYAKARLGSKDFKKNGQLLSSVTGPSGETVEARVKISRYFPSATEVGEGKDASGRDRIKLGPFTK